MRVSTAIVAWPLMLAQSSVADSWDVLVYGSTPAGIAAAVAASRVGGGRVALLEQTAHVGGMSSPGGIGMRDFASTKPCGSVLEWMALNSEYYGKSSGVWQPDNYVGEANFRALLNRANVSLFTGELLVEGPLAVVKDGTVIKSVTTKKSGKWSAGQFIDASYEGDLARFAGVSVTYGRESTDQYGEDLAGVRKPAPGFEVRVNATWPDGSLLKYVSDKQPGELGSADDGVMAFSYRTCVTKNVTNQAPFKAPEGYDAKDFELHRRYLKNIVEAGKTAPSFEKIFGVYPYRGYPRRKHDLCDANTFSVTSDVPDQQSYVMGSYEERARIESSVRYYVQGYLYMLATDSEVPESTRLSALKYGLCKDEWPENGHFPTQMYVREGLRIVGDRVFTQKDWAASRSSESIGIGSWGLDIHVVHRYADSEGVVRDEGYTSPGTGQHAYELPFSLVLPKRSETTNLAVPVCLSCSHVTWAGLREEPTMWQLGAASGTAAALAGAAGALRDVDISVLQASIVSQGCKVDVPGPSPPMPPTPPPSLHDGDVIVKKCNAEDAMQQWKVVGSAIYLAKLSPQQCLTYNASRAASGGHGQAVIVSACGSEHQMWDLSSGDSIKTAESAPPCISWQGKCDCVNIVSGLTSVEMWGCGQTNGGEENLVYNASTGLISAPGDRCLSRAQLNDLVVVL